MAKLIRQLDGTYITDTGKNVGNLDAAAARGNPTDLANIEYAKKTYGYVPKSTTITPSAGSTSGVSSPNNLLPNTPTIQNAGSSLVPSGVSQPSDEADIFNLLTRDALLKFQGVNTADLEKKKRALQMTAIGKQSEVTPKELQTFSPTQQAAIRSGNIKALQPEFDEVKYQLDKAQQATQNFENIYEKVMTISKDYAEKMTAPDSVVQNYKKLIEADPENINTYIAKVNDKTRDAILQSLDYEKIRAATAKSNLLTPSEANQLNVPYGTTREEAAAMGIIPKNVSETITDGLTPAQLQNFMSITNKYQADALVQAFDKGQGLNAIANQVIKDPNNAANQLKSLYVLVKNLDPDSAVREGEIALANQTQSYLQTFETSLARIAKGQVIAPDTAKSLAVATQELVGAWGVAKDAREARYKSQANIAGVGDAFEKYLSGTANPNDPLGLGFNSVGSDTNKAVITKAVSISDGEKIGECGRFVNKLTGLGLGDSYQSKMAKMDSKITNPAPGMVFVMPYKDTGHTGIILSVNDGIATVKDSNYSLDGKVKTHQIPVSKMTGFRMV